MSDDPPEPPTSAPDHESGRLAGLLAVDGDVLDRVFAVLLFCFFGGLLAATPRYSPDSRLFPLVIGVPTIVLLSVLILAQTSERVGSLIEGFASADLFGLDERFSAGMGGSAGRDEPLSARRKRLAVMAGWMGLLFVLVVVVGFIPATIVFLVAFFRVYAGVGWPRTVGYTVVFTAMVVLVFDLVMGTRLYEGLLRIRLPF